MIKIKTGTSFQKPDYCGLNCTSKNRNVDSLLDSYLQIKEYILELIHNDPSKLVKDLWLPYTGILCSDSDCKCRAGTYDQENVLKSYARCVQCSQIGRIADFNYNLINRPFKINAGKMPGKYLILEQYPNYVPSIQLKNQTRLSSKHITEYYQSLSICDSIPEENLKYVISDPMTNNLLISTIIGSDAVNLYTAYLCGTDGYTLSDSNLTFLEYVAFLEDSPIPTKEILKQLIQILEKLSLYNFTHNNPTIKAIQYDLVDQKVKLCNFEDSCITYNQLRFIGENKYSDLVIKNEPIEEEIESKLIGDKLSYNFNYETGLKILHLRRLGINLYSTSFTLYCYLIALMSQPEFYKEMDMNLWQKLWSTEEYEVLDQRLKLNHQKSNIGIDQIIQTLTRLSLRCDILKYLNFLLNV